MNFEDLKNEAISLLDDAWEAVKGSADVELAREVAGRLTTELGTKVLEIGQHLFGHVTGNANETAAPVEADSVPVEPVEPAPVVAEATAPTSVRTFDPPSVVDESPAEAAPEAEPTA